MCISYYNELRIDYDLIRGYQWNTGRHKEESDTAHKEECENLGTKVITKR